MPKTLRINLCFCFLLFFSLSLYAGVRNRDLAYVMPSADTFKLKKKPLRLYEAFRNKELVGFCFLSTDIVTNSTGYNGKLTLLVGMNRNGTLAGIKVLKHRENIKEAFAIEKPGFESQFRKKKLTDRFLVGADVDNITGATVTVKKIARIVKKSSEKVFSLYFHKKPAGTGTIPEIPEEEDEVLNPKWPIQKIDPEALKAAGLSEKEAEFYEKR
jgi:transcriptional regulator of nitric oxide reductase